MLVRAFNEQGMSQFRRFLEQYQNGTQSQDAVVDLVKDTSISTLCEPRLEVDVPRIAGKRELAKVICDGFETAGYAELPIRRRSMIDRGIWTWLAASAFHLIRTRRADRRLRDYAYYIADENWNRIYRHRIAGPARHYWLFRKRVRNASLLLYGQPYELSDWEEQLGGRLHRIRNLELIAAIHTLYWDNNRARPKRGAQTRGRAGTLRRFLAIMSQLDLTYDLQSINAHQILDLLPSEFDRWKN